MPSQSIEKPRSLPGIDIFIVEWMIADPLASNHEAELIAAARLDSRDCEDGSALTAGRPQTVREP